MKRAPKRLSTAMRIALADIRKVEKDPRYQVNMHFWHRPILSGPLVPGGETVRCQVCFAGSVMAKTLDYDPNKSVYGTEEAESGWDKVFTALNYAHIGEVKNALEDLGRNAEKLKPGQVYIPVFRYEENPVLWRKDMFKIVHMLERMGE